MKTFVLAGLMLAIVTQAFAQPALPVCKRPVSLAEAVRAMRTNDRTVFNADCMKIVEAYNATYKPQEDERPKSCEDLAQFMEKRWSVADAPFGVGGVSFTRIMPNGSIDLYGFSRPVRAGEQWAYDNQLGLWVMSMYCCNFPSNDALPLIREEPVRITAPEPLPPLREQAGDSRFLGEGDEVRRPREGQQSGPSRSPNWFSMKRNGKWFWPVVGGLAGGGLVCAAAGCFDGDVTQIVCIGPDCRSNRR